jgi:F0F1-type ATP synthase assembly protein I
LWLTARVAALGQMHVLRALPVMSPSDDRSPAAKAYQWASRIMIVSLEMVLPGLAGYWIDQQLGTMFLFMLIGLTIGCVGGIWHLLRLTSADAAGGTRRNNGVRANKSRE